MCISGGVRQRLHLDKKPDPVDVAKRERTASQSLATARAPVREHKRSLNEVLRGFVRDGRISAEEAAEAARGSANTSDEDRRELSSWGLSGSSGDHPKNTARDIKRKLQKRNTAPPLYARKIPFWNPKTCVQYEDTMYFQLPHETVDALVDEGIDVTTLPEDSPLNDTRERWRKKANDIAPNSPIAVIQAWGDSAVMTVRDSIYVVLFSLMSGNWKTRVVFGAWSKKLACGCGCYGRHTFDAIWSVFGWSLAILRTKIWPTHRDDGVAFEDSTQVGDKWRAARAIEMRVLNCWGACLNVCGDWQFYKQVFALCGWKAEGFLKCCCFRCKANKGKLNFRDGTMGAKWRNTIITHLAYVTAAHFTSGYVSAIFGFPLFEFAYITVDVMHAGCLGALPAALGNTYWELFRKFGGTIASPDEALGDLLTLIRQAGKAAHLDNPPINNLTMGMIKNSGKPPKMKTKAAESRYLLTATVYLLKHIEPPTNDHDRTRLHMLEAIADMYLEFKSWGDLSAQKIGKCARQHVILYRVLSDEAAVLECVPSADQIAWRMYPKHHLMIHAAEDDVKLFGNPTTVWNYMNESCIGDVVKTSQKCHVGALHRTVVEKLRS